MFPRTTWLACLLFLNAHGVWAVEPTAGAPHLHLGWTNGMLTVSGGRLPAPVPIHYLEAYCRPGSTDRDWSQTVIPHRSELIGVDPAGERLELRDILADGVVVEHRLIARADEVEFRVEAHNPAQTPSLAHWAQPCMRVEGFTGGPKQDTRQAVPAYVRKCFIFVAGKLHRLPTDPWALRARYVPGQVWAAPGVDRDDVNPRPLSQLIPSNGLIGCYSADERLILAIAWEPWQELFQGVITCVHSDFRIGGLAPGERKVIRGRLYVVEADPGALVKRYERDFGVAPTR